MTRLSPERFAAAAAVYDPSLLMRVQAQPAKPRRPRAALRGETGGAVLLAATKGLMTLFFLVVGLEAKRERDLGELRDGRRLTVPVLAALAVISLVYPGEISPAAIVVAGALLTLLLSMRAIAARQFRARGDSTAALTPLSARSVMRLTPGELRGTAMSAGVGFTVSLLIASRAFDGALLDQAKVGILATALLAPLLAAMALRRVAPVLTPCVAR